MSVANRKPLFIGQPQPVVTSIPASANTNRDGSGTIVTIYTAGANCGSLIQNIKAQAVGTTNAGVLNLFHSVDNGSTWKLIGDLLVAAVTPSATAVAWSGYFSGNFLPLPMAANAQHKLGLTTTIAQAFTVIVDGGTLENTDTAPVAQ